MAANIITKFVLKQLAKKSARKTGIASLKKASDLIVQSNVKNIEIILKNMGIDPKNLKSTDDVLKHMNIHKAMMNQHLKQDFKGLGLGKGIESLGKKDPFQGFTPKIVKDKTLLKDSPEAIAKIKAENKAARERLKEKKKDWRKDEDWDDKGPWDESKKDPFKDEDWNDFASGGIAGELHLNQGGRVSFTKGGKVSRGLAHVLGA